MKSFLLFLFWVDIAVIIHAFSSQGRPKQVSETSYYGHSSLTCLYSNQKNGEAGEGHNKDKNQQQPKSNPNDNFSSNNNTNKKKPTNNIEDKERRKSQIAKAAAKIIKRDEEEATGLLGKLNPFQAGKSLRKSLDSALTSLARASSGSGVSSEDRQRSLYYLDDRFRESGGALFTQETNTYLERLEAEDYIPEVLVVGATGEVGRLVVRRLLLEGRSRVRVLVPDLYSKTLNMLGTGVVYCQGDLNNMDSLEYALTDVDKIVFCAAAPRPDEEGFQEKFLGFAKDNLDSNKSELGVIESISVDKKGATTTTTTTTKEDKTETDMEWERLESVMEIRAQLAEQVDYIGVQNLVKAYQNVRHADYGTSQAAKRSLFKFQNRPEDFNLFAIDDTSESGEEALVGKTYAAVDTSAERATNTIESGSSMERRQARQTYAYPATAEDDPYSDFDDYADEYEKYADDEMEDDYVYGPSNTPIESRQDTTVKTQVQWIRNEFGHGVFVGKVPKSSAGKQGGEASIISSRLRSRDGGPDDGIDLSGGFGGFVCRVCSDGGNYEAFVRDAAYDEKGIEYVCEFSTASKAKQRGNASKNKFVTVRLPFMSFRPVRRRATTVGDIDFDTIPPFRGRDVRHIGFRYRSSENSDTLVSSRQKGELSQFYLALSYIKLYRLQPEPEFVFLSDARIPPVLQNGQVRDDIRQVVSLEALSSSSGTSGYQIFDDKALQDVSTNKMARSPEETYFKLRGEQVIRNSGLSYAIIRVAGYNESPSSEASTIDLKSTDDDIKPISRAEVAQVCVSALLDPNALNKSFYVSKKKQSSSNIDESMSEKFRSLVTDSV